jgi:hypothetical protein
MGLDFDYRAQDAVPSPTASFPGEVRGRETEMRTSLGLRTRAGLLTLLAAAVTALAVFVPGAGAVSGAVFTTFNGAVDGSGHCQNSAINCNIYDGKDFVWLNGGPANNKLSPAGQYFFAVLVPGGQPTPNDLGAKNLSDDFDNYTNRTFTVGPSGEVTAYSGTHDLDSGVGAAGSRLGTPNGNPPLIRLMPYADTTNPGGVYIMAVCYLGPEGTSYPVEPRNCKYDAFKVNESVPTPTASDLVPTKNADASWTRTFKWNISKDVDKTEIDQSGTSATFNYTIDVSHDSGTDAWGVSGTISVLNANDDQVTGVDVTDAVNDNALCTVDDGSYTDGGGSHILSATNGSIPANTSVMYPYSCAYSGLPYGDPHTNTVSVTWPEQTLSINGKDETLAGNAASPAQFSVDFDFPSSPALSDDCVDVTDQLDSGSADSLATLCVDANGAQLDASNVADGVSVDSTTNGDKFVVTYGRQFTGTSGKCVTHSNTAAFLTDDGAATGSSNEVDVKLCVGANLTAEKGASPSFTRTYNWLIGKAVDRTTARVNFPGSATFNYTVTVRSGTPAFTDSGWQVTGTIKVSNPNDWEDIVATITDSVDNGGTCVVTNGVSQTVPKSSYIQRNYTCTWTSAPTAASGTNTAMASWDSGTYSTPNGSASGTAGFGFSTPTTEVNKTITVTDSYRGTLGTVTYGVTSLPRSFTYSRAISASANQCATYPNTATIVQTGQYASQSVRVCPTVNGLTIGYWANKNGQSRITNSPYSAGVCNLTASLTQYAPFQDLPTTASCSAVATYVYNVIKAANSSGSSMNAMLKAQMLATALNVPFGVTNGSELIDLTQVCKMIDGSNGSATCSGTYQNAGSAFGGASSMTVLQILSYAAGQSSAGGSLWYGNVKATQELAKNVFDAINNGVALSA